ncbi:hypothetical protein BJY59DRAFT_704029 [Rhodotorula toruloides]
MFAQLDVASLFSGTVSEVRSSGSWQKYRGLGVCGEADAPEGRAKGVDAWGRAELADMMRGVNKTCTITEWKSVPESVNPARETVSPAMGEESALWPSETGARCSARCRREGAATHSVVCNASAASGRVRERKREAMQSPLFSPGGSTPFRTQGKAIGQCQAPCSRKRSGAPCQEG